MESRAKRVIPETGSNLGLPHKGEPLKFGDRSD